MRKIRCCVIDDEPLACSLIKSYIEKTPFLEFVASYTSASAAVHTIVENNVDLVFLDIQMAEINGMEFTKIIPSQCKVIFVTAFENYAIEAFKVDALDYLLKPVDYSEFLVAANKALRWFSMAEGNEHKASELFDSTEQSLIVKSEYKLIQIPLDQILYIEGLKDYVRIYLDDPERQPILSLMSLKNLEETLPSSRFMRIHRSYIVQLSKIRVIERNRIVFGRQYLPISESYKEKFQDYVANHSSGAIKADEY